MRRRSARGGGYAGPHGGGRERRRRRSARGGGYGARRDGGPDGGSHRGYRCPRRV
uniref:Uncharacterized protein n=1 Tax=Arundo donax TaxID=35708 RepID=A0A0A9C9Z9_ARUDO